jgi:hypothetical protein
MFRRSSKTFGIVHAEREPTMLLLKRSPCPQPGGQKGKPHNRYDPIIR